MAIIGKLSEATWTSTRGKQGWGDTESVLLTECQLHPSHHSVTNGQGAAQIYQLKLHPKRFPSYSFTG